MRILSLSLDEILKETKDLELQQKNLKHEITKLCWYMRGGITLEEAYSMSAEDREVVSKVIKENLETTKSSGLPFF